MKSKYFIEVYTYAKAMYDIVSKIEENPEYKDYNIISKLRLELDNIVYFSVNDEDKIIEILPLMCNGQFLKA